MRRKSLILGCEATELSAEESDFIRANRPAGLILFRRNCQSPRQLRSLTSTFRALYPADEPSPLVLIDEEGGRVQRLRPPVGRMLPAAADYLTHFRQPAKAAEAAALVAERTAADLLQLGINANCAPVADLRFPGAHEIVGDRAYATTPADVALIAGAVAQAFLRGGVLPVIKHIPGHGRASCDSHHELPVVGTGLEDLTIADFKVFAELRSLPAAMTAHVVYQAVDPDRPATVSPAVVSQVIRARIGFDGLLMTDDLSMKALSGTLAERATAAVGAGCDLVLHCDGDLTGMREVAAVCPALAGDGLRRYQAALDRLHAPQAAAPDRLARAEAVIAEVLGTV